MKRKVAILGASGQLGKCLLAAITSEFELVATERVDLLDDELLRRFIRGLRPDIVINAAAYTAVDRAESEPELAHRVNGNAVRTIARELSTTGGKLVHISTDYVFDGLAHSPYRIDAPTNPQSVYGASKLAGENAISEEMDAKNTLVIRPSWVYANGGANFVETMLSLARQSETLRVVADQIGTPTSARNLASAIWSGLSGGATGTHHFTDAGVASWYDFAVIANKIGHRLALCPARSVVPITTAEFPRPAKRPSYSVLDKSRSWLALGAEPVHWVDALEQELRLKAMSVN